MPSTVETALLCEAVMLLLNCKAHLKPSWAHMSV